MVAADQWTENQLIAGEEAHRNGTPFEFFAMTNAHKVFQDYDPKKHKMEDVIKDKRFKRSLYYEKGGSTTTKTKALASNQKFFAAFIRFKEAVENREMHLLKQRASQSKLRAEKARASKTGDASEKIAAADNDDDHSGRIVTATTVPSNNPIVEKLVELQVQSSKRQDQIADAFVENKKVMGKMAELQVHSSQRQDEFADAMVDTKKDMVDTKKVQNKILETIAAHEEEIEDLQVNVQDLGHDHGLLQGRMKLTEAKQKTTEADVDDLYNFKAQTEDKTEEFDKLARLFAQKSMTDMAPEEAKKFRSKYKDFTGNSLSDASSIGSSSSVKIGRNSDASDASDENCFGGKPVNHELSPRDAAKGGVRSWLPW
mmetsp:Transcript_46597/g.52835  ORF Transcript_46597/g.52835 Transcript_46597/m.52835 type:complete len:371 (-) Transcript_46597:219-1331(-)